ncbi:cation:proton antiporter [Actinomycetospora sp. CA-101289]|uniref:cation:proton antiporter n=1 Tax=Actinomycetospora sp. CA-101289 TaxID=3239893 RepID=UPI003D979828
MALSLASAAVVATVALLAPLTVRWLRLPVPEIVVQIVAGAVIGPQVLGLATADAPVAVLATVGLGFLLLLAGLEVDLRRLRGRVLRLTLAAFALSFALACGVGAGLAATGLVRSPLLIAVILSATGLGIVLPVLEDTGVLATSFGQVLVAGASIAEVVPIVLLSLLFTRDGGALGSRLVLLGVFLGLVLAVVVLLLGVERSRRLSRVLVSLQDTTAEIRVRGAVCLLLLLAAAAAAFGLEGILGAFLAGVALSLLDRDETATHSLFRTKLQAVGFGAFVPFFFVSTGMGIDVRGLVGDPATLAKVPIFVVALLVVRALPAGLYASLARGGRQVVAAGLVQATSLSIPVVAGAIGVDLGVILPGTYAALVAAGLVSVIVFPPVAASLLGGRRDRAPSVS